MHKDTGEPEIINLTALPEDEGSRLDQFISNRKKSLSRSRVQKLLEAGKISVNDQAGSQKNYRIRKGDRIRVILPPPEKLELIPEEIELHIVYEDDDLIVLNKSRGMVVHPSPGHRQGTLVNALLSHCDNLSGIGGVKRPGIVHRLDKDTTGLLLVAKNDFSHSALAAQLKERTLHRGYIALVLGKVKPIKGIIEAPLGRHRQERKKMAVISEGRHAVTHYRVIKHFGNYSLVSLELDTGRTHQIRVHMATIGYPVIGDPLYGCGKRGEIPQDLIKPQMLHARRLSFSHPRTGQQMTLSAPPPEDFQLLIQWLHQNEAKR